ncbi:MAG: hypothetical protein M0Q51_17355 [Bacteroidales bacterium]|nr:hypothetical protein [Bacteroidales bacterium]
MRVIVILSALLIIQLSSCKKENNYEIIRPGSYFPVYPNSWWKYLKNNTDTVTVTTSETYILHKYELTSDPHPVTYSDPVYVPFYSGRPIYGYDKIDYCPWIEPHYSRWPILREEIGYSYSREWWCDERSDYECEMVVVKDKIFNGQDSVLILESTFECPYPCHMKRYREFTKYIGSTLDILYDSFTFDTISKSVLIDYHITFDTISKNNQ